MARNGDWWYRGDREPGGDSQGQTLNTGRRRQDEKTVGFIWTKGIITSQARQVVVGQARVRQQAGSRTGEGSSTGGQSDRRLVGNRRAVGQAMGRQQAGSRTGDGSATGGQSDRRWFGNRRAVGQAMGRQQAGSRTGNGLATGG